VGGSRRPGCDDGARCALPVRQPERDAAGPRRARRDERWLKIDVYATAASGLTVITVLIGAWLVELARGGDGSPYGQVLAIGGLAYIAAVAFFRWRS
jgi:hypothetical protein